MNPLLMFILGSLLCPVAIWLLLHVRLPDQFSSTEALPILFVASAVIFSFIALPIACGRCFPKTALFRQLQRVLSPIARPIVFMASGAGIFCILADSFDIWFLLIATLWLLMLLPQIFLNQCIDEQERSNRSNHTELHQ